MRLSPVLAAGSPGRCKAGREICCKRMGPLRFQPLLGEHLHPYMSLVNRRGIEMAIRQKIAKFVAYRRTLRELMALDNAQLRDLGITRGDIRTIARGELL